MVNDNSGGILSKMLIVNVLWVALLSAAWNKGWLQYLFDKDVTFISHLLAIGAIVVIIISLQKGAKISKSLQDSESLVSSYAARVKSIGAARRTDVREALKTELQTDVASVSFLGNIALFIGVLGTVIGLILGFQHIDPNMISNVENAGATVAQLLVGLSVAFHTTLVGGLVYLWLRINHFMLVQGQAKLYSLVLEG
jgi:hypothetical protein